MMFGFKDKQAPGVITKSQGSGQIGTPDGAHCAWLKQASLTPPPLQWLKWEHIVTGSGAQSVCPD